MFKFIKDFVSGLIMCIIFTLSMLFFANLCHAEPFDCNTHKLFCEIIKFNPHMDRAEAMNLSNKIYSKAKLNNIDPVIALAILLQESGLKHINTFKTTIQVKEECDSKSCVKTTTTIEKLFDTSIAQINVNTAADHSFDIERLYKGDIDYALDCFFTILKEKIILCKTEQQPWACYNSVNEPYKSEYIALVSRFL